MCASSVSSTEVSPRPRRRWFQFRLRTLLIGVLLLSVCLSGYAWLRERARRRAKAVATLREMGVYVIYESDASDTGEESMVPWRRWESGSDLLSRDFFENVVGVAAGEFDKNGPNPLPLADPKRFWNAVCELPALKGVSVITDQVTPEDLRVLQNHRDLEFLYIQAHRVSDEHLREIGRLEGLRDLIVEGDWLTARQAQISHVRQPEQIAQGSRHRQTSNRLYPADKSRPAFAREKRRATNGLVPTNEASGVARKSARPECHCYTVQGSQSLAEAQRRGLHEGEQRTAGIARFCRDYFGAR